jgi:hypothetical protein
VELGYQISASTIQAGLRELNPDISFDAPLNRPGDYEFILKPQGLKSIEEQRTEQGGVYYKGNHVAPLDRGIVPEYRIWSSKDGVEEVSMMDVLKYDDSKIAYMEIPPTHADYNHALTMAERGDDNWTIANGKVYRYQAFRYTKVPDRILRAGWRYTFEALVGRRIPGITRKSLALKFGIDMTPQQIRDADKLVDEGHKPDGSHIAIARS